MNFLIACSDGHRLTSHCVWHTVQWIVFSMRTKQEADSNQGQQPDNALVIMNLARAADNPQGFWRSKAFGREGSSLKCVELYNIAVQSVTYHSSQHQRQKNLFWRSRQNLVDPERMIQKLHSFLVNRSFILFTFVTESIKKHDIDDFFTRT